jgi:prepilin-type N-terminal cleavage/methylation domain-containing protein
MRYFPMHIRHGIKSGFTLLELMLVLAIIALIGAILVPTIDDVLERQKLRSSATKLRVRWDEARLEAMRTGQAQVFTCTLESQSFSVKPLLLASDEVNTADGATVMSGGGLVERADAGMMTAPDASESAAEELDDEISFHACIVAGDARAMATAQQAQQNMAGVNDLSVTTVAQRVIFYPDGSTSTAEVQVKNKRGDIRAIQMRGITGHTRVVEVLNVPSESK